MNKIKKTLAVLLSCVTLFTCTAVFSSASVLLNADKDTVTIFVEGINAAEIQNAETGEALFAPSASTIVSAVAKCLPQIAGTMLTGNFEPLKQPLVDAANGIFMPIACDESGKPLSSTRFDWEWKTEEDILAQLEREDYGAQIKYCYDWRLDMKTIATDLHSYIEYVMDIAGVSKVNLIGFSMGTCAVMSYLKLYDYEYVNAVVLLAGAYNGVNCCGEPFAGKVNLDPDALIRFADSMLMNDASGIILKNLLHSLYCLGVVNSVTDYGNVLVAQLSDAVYGNVFSKTFATMPGMWSLVPADCYDDAMAIIGDSLSDTTLEMIRWYHDEVQANITDIIDGCSERGINFGIVSKYGFPGFPVMDDANSMGDGIIDTTYESLGATCADADTTLGDGYTQAVDVGFDCVSPDNMIDASTCVYPEYTWFIKNCYHSDCYREVMPLCYSIIEADEQITVNSGEYGQFLTVDRDTGELVGLDESNDKTVYVVDPASENLIGISVKSAKAMFELVVKNFKEELKAFRLMFTKVC